MGTCLWQCFNNFANDVGHQSSTHSSYFSIHDARSILSKSWLGKSVPHSSITGSNVLCSSGGVTIILDIKKKTRDIIR